MIRKIEIPADRTIGKIEISTDRTFPVQKYWRWSVVRYRNRTLNPWTSLVLWDHEAAGWLYYVHAIADNPDITLRLDLASLPDTMEIEVSFRDLYEMGFTNSIHGFRVLRYDDTSRVYSAEFAPGISGYLGAPFRDRIKAIVVNPTDKPVTFSINAWMIMLEM